MPIQPDRYPGAHSRAGDARRGHGSEHAGSLLPAGDGPAGPRLADRRQIVNRRALLRQHTRYVAQAGSTRKVRLIEVRAKDRRPNHRRDERGGQRHKARTAPSILS
jgi:hypothetical protein